MFGILRRQAQDCSQVQKITWCTGKLYLCVGFPQDMAEVLELPDLEEKSDPITGEGHRSSDVPAACTNRIGEISCMKL